MLSKRFIGMPSDATSIDVISIGYKFFLYDVQ
jgi:hypothetical protein